MRFFCYQILRPTFPGMMRYIAKNIFNLVTYLFAFGLACFSLLFNVTKERDVNFCHIFSYTVLKMNQINFMKMLGKKVH